MNNKASPHAMTPVTMSSRGEIVIPKKIRERYGLNRFAIKLVEREEGILIQPLKESPEETMDRWSREAEGLPEGFDPEHSYYEEMMEERVGKYIKNIR